MSQISKRVRDAVRTRLADATYGFNARLAAAAPSYGVTPFTIDFATPGRNFFQGQVVLADLLATSSLQLPCATLWTQGAANRNNTKFQLFSGEITLGLAFYLSWRKSGMIADAESLGDAVEDAVIACLNDPAWDPQPVLWNGDAAVQRHALSMGGANWVQPISFRLTFELDTL